MKLAWLGLGSVLSLACAAAPCPCESHTPSSAAAKSAPSQAPEPQTPMSTGPNRETRTPQVIASVIADNRQKIRDCYERERSKQRDLRGSLTVSFTLDPKGKVVRSSVVPQRTTLSQPSLHQCALSALATIAFPPSSRGFESQVTYPFDFKPQ